MSSLDNTGFEQSYQTMLATCESLPQMQAWLVEHATSFTSVPQVYANHFYFTNVDVSYRSVGNYHDSPCIELGLHCRVAERFVTPDSARGMKGLCDQTQRYLDIVPQPWEAFYTLELSANDSPLVTAMLAPAFLKERHNPTTFFKMDLLEPYLEKHFPGLSIAALYGLHDGGLLPTDVDDFCEFMLPYRQPQAEVGVAPNIQLPGLNW